MSTKELLKTIKSIRDKGLDKNNLNTDGILGVANKTLLEIKTAKHSIKIKYTSKYANLVTYYYWLARIERRMVFEYEFQRMNLASRARSRRVFRYLSKKMRESLFQAIMKHGTEIENVYNIEGKLIGLRLCGIEGHLFFSTPDLVAATGTDKEFINARGSIYEKVIIANALSG